MSNLLLCFLLSTCHPKGRLLSGGSSQTRKLQIGEGNPKVLDGADLQRLADIVRFLAGRVALSSTVTMWVLWVLQKELKKMKLEYQLSVSWLEEFMKTLGLRENCLVLLLWKRDQFGLPWSRAWNMDETAARILLTGDRVWTERQCHCRGEVFGDREHCCRCR